MRCLHFGMPDKKSLQKGYQCNEFCNDAAAGAFIAIGSRWHCLAFGHFDARGDDGFAAADPASGHLLYVQHTSLSSYSDDCTAYLSAT